MATVIKYKKSPKYWHISYRDQYGNQHTSSSRKTNKKEALILAEKVQKEIDKKKLLNVPGTVVPNYKTPIKDLAEEFIKHLNSLAEKNILDKRTVEHYVLRFGYFIEFLKVTHNDKQPASVFSKQFSEQYLTWLTKRKAAHNKPLAWSALKRCFSLLYQFVKFLNDTEPYNLQINPLCLDIRFPKKDGIARPLPDSLTPPHIRRKSLIFSMTCHNGHKQLSMSF